MEQDIHQDDATETPRKPNEKGDQGDFSLNFLFAMGELNGNVKNLRTDLTDFKVEIRKDNTDLDTRLKAIETWHTKVTTAAAILGAVGGWAMEWIVRHV